jgi:hypothetical protein
MITRKTSLNHQMLEQLKWIADHGNTLAGYVARYGSANDPEHYGDGGEAIYAADVAELVRIERLRRDA